MPTAWTSSSLTESVTVATLGKGLYAGSRLNEQSKSTSVRTRHLGGHPLWHNRARKGTRLYNALGPVVNSRRHVRLVCNLSVRSPAATLAAALGLRSTEHDVSKHVVSQKSSHNRPVTGATLAPQAIQAKTQTVVGTFTCRGGMRGVTQVGTTHGMWRLIRTGLLLSWASDQTKRVRWLWWGSHTLHSDGNTLTAWESKT